MEATTFAFTADMLAPVTDAVMSGLSVVVPVGLAIFAVMLGINLVPKIIKKFAK